MFILEMFTQWVRPHQLIDISGVAHLDYFDLYRKFTYTSQAQVLNLVKRKMKIHMKHLESGMKMTFNLSLTIIFKMWKSLIN